MSDELIVSGGNSWVVATDELLAEVDALSWLVEQLWWARSLLAAIDGRVQSPELIALDAPISTVTAEEQLHRARFILARCETEALLLSIQLRASMEVYGMGEALRESLYRQLAERFAHTLGFLSPLILALAGPAVAPSLIGGGLGLMLQGKDLDDWMKENNAVLTNPFAVAVVRSVVMSTDDFIAGALHVPQQLASVLGDQGLGILGPATSAALLMATGNGVGVLSETPVRVTLTEQRPGTVAVTMEDRASRIPQPDPLQGGEQIRVDRYVQPGQPDRVELFLAGTQDFGLTSGVEPWDMTSNIAGVAQLSPGSYRAAVEVLAAAGVTPDTPIVITGYSQGGMLASELAASGDYNVQGIITIGAPAGQIVIPPDVPVLTIRHSDDLVPATGGDDVNAHAVVVERNVFAGREIPKEFAVPAHHFPYYEETARLIDEGDSAKLRDAVDYFADFGEGATRVETSFYRADRVQEEEAVE